MTRGLFCIVTAMFIFFWVQAARAEAPDIPLGRLYTVETAVSFYGGGDGAMLWVEDLRRLEAMWDCLSPQKQAEFRDFLLPIYMRETMGIPLFEETDGSEEWTDIAEKFLFDDSF